MKYQIKYSIIFFLALLVKSHAMSPDSIFTSITKEFKFTNTYYSKNTSTYYFTSSEECALINCYLYRTAMYFENDTIWISTLSAYRVEPFLNKAKKMDFGKESTKNLYNKISLYIKQHFPYTTAFYDNDNKDESLDYSTHSLKYARSYGAEIEIVRTPTVEQHIIYYSFWHIFKNGFGNLPNLDTIPSGGFFILDDFYCGPSDEIRNFESSMILPNFNKISDVDTNLISRPKITRWSHKGSAICKNDASKYLIQVNGNVDSIFRLVYIGSVKNDKNPHVSDWRIKINNIDSSFKSRYFFQLN
jgi:hypothetical protein